jgi:hypothetical protein
MSFKFDKQAAYDAGYSKGHLRDEELSELGHTRESFIDHIETTYTPDIYNPHILSDQTEFFHGLIDGARDLRRR